ncbi:MAG TPA: PQQ-dependent sugar dehydrogenase, partial [Nitrososphaeraceae archaeon]|nr:PQQ-dependent sugar dehydrogenase [Nitrososphaeraceae archaeon]
MREENILFFNKRLQIVIVFLSISLGIISIVVLNSNDSLLLLLLDKKQQEQPLQQKENPSLKDTDDTLNVELVAKGLSSPTSMSFIDNNNLLVLEKNGQVRLISNGVLQKQPVLTVSVDTTAERGLLGIAMLRGDDNSSSNSSSEKVDRNTTKVNTTTSEMIDTKTARTTI